MPPPRHEEKQRKETMINILEKANEIVNERSEEKERQYGPMSTTNERAAKIASIIGDKTFTVVDIYLMQISLKLARQSFCHKEDNLLDTVAYIGGLNNYLEGILNEENDIVKKQNPQQKNIYNLMDDIGIMEEK